MFNFNKLKLFFLFLFTLNILCGQRVVENSSEYDGAALLNLNNLISAKSGLSDSDLEFEKPGIVNPEFASFFRNPSQMAERLPENLRNEVIKAWEISGKISGMILNPAPFQDPILSVLDLCNDLKSNITNEELLDIIAQLEFFLGSQRFINAIKYNTIDEDLKKELTEKFSLLNSFISSFQTKKPDIYENLFILKNIFLAFINDNKDLYLESIDNYQIKQRLRAVRLFRKIIKKLDSFIKTENNVATKEAAIFFKEEIFEGLKPIIFSIDEKGNVDQLALFLIPFGEMGQYLLKILRGVEKTSKISPAMLFGYGFYKKILSYYLLDHHYSYKLLLSDAAVSVAFLPFYILKKISDINSLRKAGSSNEEIYFAIGSAASEISDFYSDPNFLVKKSNWGIRSIYRIGSALAYYNFWYRNHFKLSSTNLSSPLVDNHDYINNINDIENPYYRYWPREFKYLKNAVWFSFKDGYLSLGNLLERGIYSKMNNDFLKKIKENSLGLIKPELITFGLNTAIPLFASKSILKNMISLDKQTVFGEKKHIFFNSDSKLYNYLVCPVDFCRSYFSGYDSMYYVGNKNYSNISGAQYVEGRILGYLSVTLGTYFGKKASLKLKKQFGYLLGRIIVNILEKFMDFNFEVTIKNMEEDGFEFDKTLSLYQKKLIVLNDFIKTNLSILFSGDVDVDFMGTAESGMDNVLKSPDTLRKAFLSTLVDSRYFTQEELALFEKEMLDGTISPERLDEFSNKIIETLVGGIAKKIGGFIGGFSSWFITDFLVKKYTIEGPIYRQVLNGLNRS